MHAQTYSVVYVCTLMITPCRHARTHTQMRVHTHTHTHTHTQTDYVIYWEESFVVTHGNQPIGSDP